MTIVGLRERRAVRRRLGDVSCTGLRARLGAPRDLGRLQLRISDVLLAALLSTVAVVHLGPGRAHATFRLQEPAGTVRLFRVTVPHGAKVRVDARIPGGAGLRLNTAWAPKGLRCRRKGASDVCFGAGGCPFPAATWRFDVWKTGGRAGAVRVDFAVGDTDP